MSKNNSIPSLPPLYKVIDGDQSCHGGTHTWSLPTSNGPGEWHEITEPLKKCRVGFHITTDPRNHTYGDKLDVYLVEVDASQEIIRPKNEDEENEWVVARVRLVRLVGGEERALLLRDLRPTTTPTKLYAVLEDGRCPHSRFNWPVPTKNSAGEWVVWTNDKKEPNLVFGHDGLQLTTTPQRDYRTSYEVYEVEVEGEVFTTKYNGLRTAKARLLRRLSPKELDKLGVGVEREWRRGPFPSKKYETIRKRDPKGMAPAERFVLTMIEHGGVDIAGPKYDGGLCVRNAISLAISSGLEFKTGNLFNDLDHDVIEWYYVGAIDVSNNSACVAIESALGRTPWMWLGHRLGRNSTLRWRGFDVVVTSFDDTNDQFIACAYANQVSVRGKGQYAEEYVEKRVVKRFTISRDEFEVVSKRHKKVVSDETAFEKINQWLIKNERLTLNLSSYLHWTKEERAEVAGWVALRKDMHQHDKKRVGKEPPPAFMTIAAKDETTDRQTRVTIDEEVRTALGMYPTRSNCTSEYAYDRVSKVWDVNLYTMKKARMAERSTNIAALELAVAKWRALNYEGLPSSYVNQPKATKRQSSK